MLFGPRRFVLGLSLVAALVAGMGCSRKPDDNQIVQTIRAQVQKDAAIGGQINVESTQGVVTLSGHVASDAARLLASREAAEAPGVKQVLNNLTVDVAAPAAAPQPEPRKAEKPVQSEPRRRRAPQRAVVARAPEPPPMAAPAAPAPQPSATPAAAPALPPPPPPPAPAKVTVPAGTVLSVRLIDSLDSSRNRLGDTFRASLDAPIRLNGEVVIPAGADVEGRVVEASNAGAYTGRSQLALQLTKLTAHGEVYSLQTEEYGRSGGARGKGTAETIGAGAALGAIIGGIAGGGKGAAIGGMAGAGAGGVARAANKGEKITFPSETVLTFTLTQPLTISPPKDSHDYRQAMER